MRGLTLLYLGLGAAVLAWVLAGVDLNLAWRSAVGIGWGLAVVLAVYLVAFYVDSLSWHLAITGLPLTPRWSYVVWRIRMVGEAFNLVLPAGGFGGEPVKAMLLKRHHAVTYGEGTASLILARTVNLIALIGFMVVGLALLAKDGPLADRFGWLAAGGFAFLTFGIGVVFAVQKFRGASVTGKVLERTRAGRWIAAGLDHVRAVEDRLIHFYTARPKRFLPALGLAFANWCLGMAETWAALHFLGHPVTIAEAWIIESVAQMVRCVTFFIPANLGTQDGVLVVLIGAVTGVPEVGVAAAAVKRLRDLVFVLWGFALGSIYSLRGLMRAQEAGEAPNDNGP